MQQRPLMFKAHNSPVSPNLVYPVSQSEIGFLYFLRAALSPIKRGSMERMCDMKIQHQQTINGYAIFSSYSNLVSHANSQAFFWTFRKKLKAGSENNSSNFPPKLKQVC